MNFILKSILLGAGLAMDAFSVSLANGLHDPCMKARKMCGIAGVFALFQALMPLIGWYCVHSIAARFAAFEPFIPWIALVLLGFLGGKMLLEGIRGEEEQSCESVRLSFGMLLMQGVATSIDALSVGFTIADYTAPMALACALIIAAVTFLLCAAGVYLGREFGTKLAGKASVLGGVILLVIALEIVITSLL